MGVVHGLKGDAGVIAVEVAILHEIFDGVDDLGVECQMVDAMRYGRKLCEYDTFFNRFACSRRASSTVTRSASAFCPVLEFLLLANVCGVLRVS